MLPKVWELHGQGLSSRDIEFKTGIGKSTINRWLSERSMLTGPFLELTKSGPLHFFNVSIGRLDSRSIEI